MHPGQVVNVLRSAPASVLDPTCCVARPLRYAAAVPCPLPDWRASGVTQHCPGKVSKDTEFAARVGTPEGAQSAALNGSHPTPHTCKHGRLSRAGAAYLS